MKKLFIIAGALAVTGVAIAAVLYVTFPVQMTTYGGMGLNYLKTLSTPAGTVSTEVNSAYRGVAAAASPTPPADEAWPNAAVGDWPSYNRTPSSQRYSPLDQINAKNVGNLKVSCTYDVHEFTSFESGLIMVNNALIGTTEYDIFSINPSTCAENWRTHLDYPGALLPSNRGAAYMDGMLFRGTQDGRVLAFDFKTGKQLWDTTIADPKHGESVPSAPIAWDGLVFVGNSGGDYKGGKGHVFALEGKTGKIVWEFFLAPKVAGDTVRGPLGATPLDASTWNNAPGIPISGAGTWTSYTLDIKNGLLYVPGGNPAPDFASGARKGSNLYTDSVVVLDAKTGDFKNNFKVVPKDWHDYDVSSPPILLQTMGGKQLMSVSPKDGHLYGYDLVTNNQLYRVPVTTIENDGSDFAIGQDVHFCPGPVGGNEWNTPGYDPATNLIVTGTVDWCDTVTIQDDRKLRSVAIGQPWTGMATLNPINMFGKESRTDGYWAGWVYATDADTGVWKWRVKSNYPIVGAITPTAGGIVFFGDLGGNFYALDSSTGQKLFGQVLGGGGGIGGGIITYTAGGEQKVAVAAGFTMVAWPTKPVTAKVVILGLGRR
ncbi:PQQ-binding-like beta-propeller repeat protein [Paraburkholderia sp. RL18-103-BIB-C]|jgi:alcohol dehydrogenase (cytochrome c)|uniref:outer membrane protein assembly factor BamB family protein n=1 Tax=unclassified Paraburkholderia TaxID=2615204 RepID=UPI0038B9F1ED